MYDGETLCGLVVVDRAPLAAYERREAPLVAAVAAGAPACAPCEIEWLEISVLDFSDVDEPVPFEPTVW